jgi:F-type H+-transporting ATPase subunit delta
MIETRGPEEKPMLGEPPMKGTHDVTAQRVALVYAEALFNAADSKGKTDEVLDELRSLVRDVFRARPELETLLGSPAIGRERREALIRKALQSQASELFLSFLIVLNRHDRLELIRAILAEAEVLNDKRKKRVRVRVRAAVPLPEDQQDKLRAQLRDVLQSEPTLEIKVDPELIGGLIVQAGDYLYDSSVRTQLQEIRNQLIERSSHEIQSGRDRFSSDEGNR